MSELTQSITTKYTHILELHNQAQELRHLHTRLDPGQLLLIAYLLDRVNSKLGFQFLDAAADSLLQRF